MSKSINIKVKSHTPMKTNKGASELVLNLSGKNMNHVIVNSIKRIIQSDVPIYSFDNFTITHNDSVFNNNYVTELTKLRDRLVSPGGGWGSLDSYIGPTKITDPLPPSVKPKTGSPPTYPSYIIFT